MLLLRPDTVPFPVLLSQLLPHPVCSCDGSCCSSQHGRPGWGSVTKTEAGNVVADMTVLVAERVHKKCTGCHSKSRGTLEPAGFASGGLRCPFVSRPPYLLVHHCSSRCSLVYSTVGSTQQYHLRRGPSKLSVRCQLLYWEPGDLSQGHKELQRGKWVSFWMYKHGMLFTGKHLPSHKGVCTKPRHWIGSYSSHMAKS